MYLLFYYSFVYYIYITFLSREYIIRHTENRQILNRLKKKVKRLCVGFFLLSICQLYLHNFSIFSIHRARGTMNVNNRLKKKSKDATIDNRE
jgi:hypothetical protein